jgi:hypothetical protein
LSLRDVGKGSKEVRQHTIHVKTQIVWTVIRYGLDWLSNAVLYTFVTAPKPSENMGKFKYVGTAVL